MDLTTPSSPIGAIRKAEIILSTTLWVDLVVILEERERYPDGSVGGISALTFCSPSTGKGDKGAGGS